MDNDTPYGPDDPDYVALVVEWNDVIDPMEALENEIATQLAEPPPPRRRAIVMRRIATALGAIGVLVLAGWGIHKLRAA
ncbi:MAG: hypothetical protein ACTHU0_28545 [Kofleriaceae bacterium]